MGTELEERYGKVFQSKVIYVLLTNIKFLRKINDILYPEFFDVAANEWIVGVIKEYYKHYKSTPTKEVFQVKINEIENPDIQTFILNALVEISEQKDSTDLQFISDEFTTFCRNQAIKRALLQSVDLLKDGKFDSIQTLMNKALRAGLNNEIGHDYKAHIEDRYKENYRNVIPTPWQLINDNTEGGFGKGELIIFVACPGRGKCVGPDTELEIEYEEVGIQVPTYDGKFKTLWYKPWEKIELCYSYDSNTGRETSLYVLSTHIDKFINTNLKENGQETNT